MGSMMNGNQLEEELKIIKEQLSNAQRIGHLGNWEWNVKDNLLSWSDEVYNIFGLEKQNTTVNYETFLQFIHPEDYNRVVQQIENAMHKGKPYSIDHSIILKNHEIKFVHSEGEVISNEEGDPVRMFGIIQDITERYKISQKLLLTQFSVDKARDAVFWVGSKGELVYINEAACKSLEYEEKELILKTIFDIDTTFSKDRWKEHWAKSRGLKSYMIETTHKTKYGRIFPVEVNFSFISFEGKEYHSAIARDISERKKAEAQLKLNQFGIDNSQIGIYQIEDNGDIIYANNYACKSLGYSLNEMLALKLWDIDPRIKPEKWKQYRENTKLNEVITIETKQRRKDGKEFPVEVQISFIEFENKSLSFSFVKDITERKLAEEKIKQSEKEYRRLFENAHDAILIINTDDNTILDVNNRSCEIYGYSKSEFRGMPIKNIAKYFDRTAKNIEEVVLKGHLQNFETIHINKEGNELIFEVNASIIEYKGKKAALCLYHDITKRKSFEEQIKNEIKRTKSLVRIASQLNSILDIDKVLDMVCKETSQTLNVPSVSIFLYNKDKDNLKLAKSTGISNNGEKYIPMISSSEFNELINKSRSVITIPNILDTNNSDHKTNVNVSTVHTLTFTSLLHNEELIGVLGIMNIDDNREYGEDEIDLLKGIANQAAFAIQNARLLSEYKKTEQALRSNEFLLKESQKIARLGHYSFEISTGMWDCSETLHDIFGIESNYTKDFNGWLNIVHPDSRELMLNYFKNNVLNELEPFDKEYKILRVEDEQEHWVHGIGQLQLDNEGNVIRMIGTIQDITDRKKYESEIISAKEKAEEMSRLKSNFLANMSHELRTPLFGIIGLSELLTYEILNPEQKEMIDAIYESSRRLFETLNLILDLSKIENNKLELNAIVFDVNAVSVNIINTFKEAAKRRGINIKYDFDFQIQRVRLDKRAYESILNNLINNAIKFTKTGGVTVHIFFQYNDRGDFLNLKVIDTGIGIAKKDFEIIFDEFRQASEGMNRNFEGSGLGLNITKKFVQRLGGTITVESELNKGTIFTVRLPILRINSPEKVLQEKRESIELKYIPLILLVDDDINVKSILTSYLNPKFNILHVSTGEEAISLTQKQKFDAILMDINLKGIINGINATKEIRRIPQYKNTPIIACTAYAMTGDKEEFLNGGCSHYIAKPFNKKEITSLLNDIFKDNY